MLVSAQSAVISNVRLNGGGNSGTLQFDNSVGSGWLKYCESDTNIIRIKSVVCRMLGYESDSERISHSSKWNQNLC